MFNDNHNVRKQYNFFFKREKKGFEKKVITKK